MECMKALSGVGDSIEKDGVSDSCLEWLLEWDERFMLAYEMDFWVAFEIVRL